MPVLLVAIDVPESVGQGAVESVLTACSQAYSHGDCELDPGTQPGGPKAQISWLSSDRIEIFIGLGHWTRHRWIRRHLVFVEADEAEERYRAVGFAVGSLAGTVVTVSQNEAVAESKPTAPTAALPPPEQKATVVATPATDAPPTPPTLPRSPFVLSAAFQVGNGPSEPSFGGRIGIDGSFASSWSVGLEFEFRQLFLSPVTLGFYSPRASVSFEARAAWMALIVALSGGAEFAYAAAVSESGDGDSKVRVNAIAGLKPVLELGPGWRVAPIIGGEIGVGRPINVDVSEERAASMDALRLVGFVGARVRL